MANSEWHEDDGGSAEYGRSLEAADDRTTARELDFQFQNEGTLGILWPLTPAAEDWVFNHLPADVTRWGRNGVVIEHRYVDDILFGIQNDGLTVRS